MTEIAFPFHVGSHGCTAGSDPLAHVTDLVEQLLFTSPGERVNRPTFGGGIMQMLFEPARPELATASQMLIQGMLQQWLGDLITVQSVDFDTSSEGTVSVTVQYLVKATQQTRTDVFLQPGT
jgi:phage baseplate assembly protein W